MSGFSAPEPGSNPSITSDGKQPIYKRKWFIALVVLGLIGAFAPKSKSSTSTNPSGAATPSEESTSTIATTTIPEKLWSENLKPEIIATDLAMSTCKELTKVVRSEAKLVASRIIATEKPSSDPYDSADYIAEIDWESTIHTDTLFGLKRAATDPVLTSGSTTIPSEGQYIGFVGDSIIACGLAQDSETLDDAAFKLDQRLLNMKSLANNLPWYPKGFVEYFSDFAFKKSSNRGLDCYSCSGIVYEVVSKKSCPNTLYVEANFMDSSGAVFDWSNDTVKALQAGQIAYVELATYGSSGSGTVKITKVDCY